MNRNQKGFSAPVILLVILVVGVLGFAGWKVIINQESDDTQVTGSSNRTTYKNQGPGMTPTISDGQVLYGIITPASEIKHGDIIVFTSKVPSTERMVKRVIGLPGDTVIIESGKVVVNKSDGSIYDPGLGEAPLTQKVNQQVSADSFFVVGDNLDNSFDSRSESFGQVSFERLEAVIKL